MIEPNNPDINVDELMAQVRDEVARRDELNFLPAHPCYQGEIPSPVVDWTRLHAGLHSAEYQVQVGYAVPEWARFGRLRRGLARFMAKGVLYFSSFITNQQKQFNLATLQALQAVRDGLQGFENDSRGSKELQHLVESLQGAVLALEQEHEAERQRWEYDRNQWSTHLNEAKQTYQGEVQRLREQLRAEREEQYQEWVKVLAEREEQHQERVKVLAEREEQHQGRVRTLEKQVIELRTSLIQQERRIGVLLEEARKRLPEPFQSEQLRVFADEEAHRLDALYVAFEDQFRGTREDIKDRLGVYLPFLKTVEAGTETRPIVDVGCGRGEWLELLHTKGLRGWGVDINPVLLAQCQAYGLDVVQGEALAYLRALPDRSVGAVTGFHLIEHLPFDHVIKLLDETVRVLKSGGIAIFETPNPQNVLVGSCNFYLDPTHRNPLPSPMMKFMAEARGLCRVEVMHLHPYPEALRVDGAELAERFNAYFYGPQDYALVGYKA